jgi:hypothetical protein
MNGSEVEEVTTECLIKVLRHPQNASGSGLRFQGSGSMSGRPRQKGQ